MRSRRTLVVISGDLSHVGPAFDGAPLHPAGKDKLRKSDMAILAAACTGQPERFLASVAAIGDRTNICGVAPLYLGLRLLGASQGRSLAYQHCPADDADTSVVSVCGITFV
jgi:AmmeMemoRadiSam system protein B